MSGNGTAAAGSAISAIVLAAGKGTRMKSAAPKVMHDICGRPMIWWVLRALRGSGARDVVLVTSPENDKAVSAVAAAFPGLAARTVIQAEQLGTGHAAQIGLRGLKARGGTVLIAYGDMPLVDADLYRAVIAACDTLTALALVTARMPLPSNFGRVIRDGDHVRKIVEVRDCTPGELAIDEMNAGIYAFDETALRDVIDGLRADNAQSEYYLTDTIALLVDRGARVVPVVSDDARAVLGVNDRVELAKARDVLNERLCEEHMRDGVTIVDPATTYLEPEITIGRDVVIYPNTAIGGATTIAGGARIGPNCRISSATVAEAAQITESVVLNSTVGAHARVGPFAHLRDRAILGADVQIGNFVEVKDSELGRGVKARHLTYLGDAEVGDDSNIGAGTITCNYDGENKNETKIGKDVFIGSNSSLVAPVNIGDGALTGAGAVVIRDVEAGDRVAGNPAKSIKKKRV